MALGRQVETHCTTWLSSDSFVAPQWSNVLVPHEDLPQPTATATAIGRPCHHETHELSRSTSASPVQLAEAP
jgi:hypothetical protein